MEQEAIAGPVALPQAPAQALPKAVRAQSDAAFFIGLSVLGGSYVLLIVAMLVADLLFTTPGHLLASLRTPEIQYAIKLSLISCSFTTLISLWMAVPLGYLLSRCQFRFKPVIDMIVDIPIVLPPLIVGLSLLILMRTRLGQMVEQYIPVTYALPGIILAQVSVSCSFAVRALRATFDEISERQEQVALTLGCSRSQAFWHVALPNARRGILAAATVAWARALGEFGPILIFAGATRMRTEVLSTTVFLELSIGNIEAAVAVSLIMIFTAALVLLVLRWFGVANDAAMAGVAR